MNAWDFKNSGAFPNNSTLDHQNFDNSFKINARPGVWCIDMDRICNVSNITENNVYRIIDKNGKVKDDKNYIYRIDMFGGVGEAFPHDKKDNTVLDLIPTNTLKIINENKNIFIMLNYFQEGIIEYFHLKQMHEKLHELKIPTNQCILMFGGHDIDSWYAEFCRNHKITQKIKIVYHNWVWKTKAKEFNEYDKNSNHVNNSYQIKPKKYNFNCLNRRLRTHRLYTLGKLEKEGLLDDNIVTYDFTIEENIPHIKEITEPENYALDANQQMDFRELKKFVFSLYENKPKKTYDFEDLQTLYGINYENASVYEDSMFSLVTETTTIPDEFYISEKTIKPIGHNHPFIVFGSKGTLRELRRMGFRTFEPFIDESYDLMEKAEDRFNIILKEVIRLCNMTDSDKLKWMKNIKHIIEYNRNHLDSFYNMNNYFNDLHNEINILIKKEN